MTPPETLMTLLSAILDAEQAERLARQRVRECPVVHEAELLARQATHHELHDAHCLLVEQAPDDVLETYDSPLARAVLMRRGVL